MQRNPSSRRPPVQRAVQQPRKIVRPTQKQLQPKHGRRALPR